MFICSLVCYYLLLWDFNPYVVIFTNVCAVKTVIVVWRSLAVKAFKVFRDNFHGNSVKGAFNFYILLFGNDALKQETFYSSIACRVHVLTYNSEKQTVYVSTLSSFRN
jgi:4-amino-4-deoxy-L-arabinose transferase-like glycosyltransferase